MSQRNFVPLIPCENRIVVVAKDLTQQTNAGLVLPEKLRTGGDSPIFEIVAVGPGRRKVDGSYEPIGFKVGDVVVMHPRSVEIAWLYHSTHYFVVMPENISATIDPKVLEESNLVEEIRVVPPNLHV